MRALAIGMIAATLILASFDPASASDLFVLHGIAGEDIGDGRTLPIDVCVGQGGLPGLNYRQFVGPFDIPAGRYDFDVRLASNPICTGPLLVPGTVNIARGESATVVAHLTEQRTPTLAKFVNADLRTPASPWVIVRHLAVSGPIDARLLVQDSVRSTVTLRNGEQAIIDPGAAVTLRLALSGSNATLREVSLHAPPGSRAIILSMVGTPPTHTFGIQVDILP